MINHHDHRHHHGIFQPQPDLNPGSGATGVSTRHGAIIQKDDGKSVDAI